MKKIKVQIMTNYFCNYRCEYCYLGTLREDRKVIDTSLLSDNLETISENYLIDSIGILGGEPTLISNLPEVIAVAKKFCQDITLITNLSDKNRIEGVRVSTSLNRERSLYRQTIMSLLLNEDKDMTLNIVVTPSILSKSIEVLIQELERYKLNVELIRYSPSVNNKFDYGISDDDYASYLKGFITEYVKKPRSFKLNNIELLNDCIEHKYSPLMDSVIFITPYNEFAAIEYTDSKEYFGITKSISDFKSKAADEFDRYKKKCSGCKFFNRCYAEHINFNNKCSGLKTLLEWYEENIYKNNRSV